jgi:hypothetical protein
MIEKCVPCRLQSVISQKITQIRQYSDSNHLACSSGKLDRTWQVLKFSREVGSTYESTELQLLICSGFQMKGVCCSPCNRSSGLNRPYCTNL